VELRQGDRAILLQPKHLFSAAEICENFERLSRVLAVTVRDGVATVDFHRDPNALNIARKCLAQGVEIESREGNVWLRKGEGAMILAPRHFVYAETLAGQFDLYFAPMVPQPRDGVMVVDYSRTGNLQRYAKSGLEFEMASFPEEEDAILEYFEWYRPQPGDLVFDVGAHCGVSTYHLSRLVGPQGKVVAFEPDPLNFELLRRNVERHGLSNVILKNAALAGSSGKLPFNAESTIGSGLASLMLRDSIGETVMVDALTLEDAFAQWGTPNFCKIDIEGAEIEVVASSEEVLRRCKTNFVFDTHHPQANGRMTTGEVERMLRNYGYEVSSEAHPLWTTRARPAEER
jgi:FkbM family methyltransferase